ncbi:FkbM family methyltransferase [Synechococcus sp. CCY9201]|uniref:FkbM family methyltransferase n=1 Tax=Synechococcus sp. CCY9201 TaxID=174697 RepID=UPI002B21C842|nr:FkbM family methyltransferase [Synechococcus sp. CCY9201]MEA5474678.1 FkbM family methyltransferase [Synechococcus sp. CCY9201]
MAERLLDYLAFGKCKRGKYRLAQLASRVLDGAVIRSAYGPLLHCRFADSTFWLAARYGNDEVMALLADLSPNDGFIDVGANIGLTTCFAAGRGAAVLSLEPSAREFADLLRNIKLLDTPPVALPVAASCQAEFLGFRIGHLSHSGGNSFGSARGSKESDVVVQAVKLDDLLTDDQLRGWQSMHKAVEAHSLVVKIDVEGFEAQVLEGMQRLLSERRCRKVIVEENIGRAKALIGDQNLTATMAQFGYEPTVDPAGRSHFDQCYVPAPT